MSFLDQQELHELIDALVDANQAGAQTRQALLANVNPKYVANLPILGLPKAQLLSDASDMNTVHRLADGTIPLTSWLQAGVFLLEPREEAKVFRAALDKVMLRTVPASTPDVATTDGTADPAKLPESKERIVHQSDLLPYGFLGAGAVSGASIARLHVHRHDGGQPSMRNGSPVMYLGTGWMIGPGLLITNYHVVEARDPGQPPASKADVMLQGRATAAQFDYNSANAPGVTVSCADVLMYDAVLDYAILAVLDAHDRPPLSLDARAIVVSADSYVPVNIIQHPGGDPKQVAIRNNLVTSASATDLRYFTDTMPGSSGSPVFSDRWQVVALHRGSKNVSGVKFQGKDTAWVNVGTPIKAILDHLRQTAPSVRDMIA